MEYALGLLNEEEKTEYWACLALSHLKNLGLRRRCRLLGHFGSAWAAVQNVKEWAAADVSPELGRLSGPWREKAKPEWEAAKTLNGHIILWTDKRYPEVLKQLPDAPAFFYARGDLSLLANPAVAVVGARDASEHGLEATRRIAWGLSACGITVISGMARGVDAAAHGAALAGPGRTVAVLGCGLDVVYPPGHERLYKSMATQGLIMSEFAPGSPPVVMNFPIRNRIISGLSLGVLVVEARLRSGSLITARMALEHNRTVYAVAGPVTSEASLGCRALIRQGARTVFEAIDIVQDLFPQLTETLEKAGAMDESLPVPKLRQAAPKAVAPRATPAKAPPAPPEIFFPHNSREAALLTLLRKHGPLHPDSLQECAPAIGDAAEISAALVMLEMAGAARRLPGMVYEAL